MRRSFADNLDKGVVQPRPLDRKRLDPGLPLDQSGEQRLDPVLGQRKDPGAVFAARVGGKRGTPTAFGPMGNGRTDGFLLKFNATANSVLFGTYMSGEDDDVAQAVAVDATGHAYVTGWTRSTMLMTIMQGDPPRVVQAEPNEVIFRSDDSGHSFVPVNNWVPSSATYGVALDPQAPDTAYQASYDLGLLKTMDAGAHWAVMNPYLNAHVDEVALDPASPNILLATAGYPYRSTDGGAHWNQVSSYQMYRFAFAPSTPSIVYAATRGPFVMKSTDTGQTWTALAPQGSAGDQTYSIAVDPGNPSVVYAGTVSGVYKTTDGGATWAEIRVDGTMSHAFASAVAIDPTLTSVVWAGFQDGSIFKSTNGGASWSRMSATSLASVSRMVFDGGTLYVADGGFNFGGSGVQTAALWKTSDRGSTWTSLTIRGNVTPVYGLDVHDGVIYASSPMHQEAFVWKLDTTSSQHPILAGTYVGGGLNDRGVGVAMDPAGSAVVAVDTDSADFPTTIGVNVTHTAVVWFTNDLAHIAASSYVGPASPPQYARGVAVGSDYQAYVVSAYGIPGGDQGTRIDRVDQTAQTFATYMINGTRSNVGQSVDVPSGIAVGAGAQVYVTGTTNSVDFPTTQGAPQPSYGSGVSDAFAAQISFSNPPNQPPPPPPPSGTNLALNRPVVTSSDFSSEYAGRFAVDGDGSTRWSSQFSDSQWIYVDLGQPYNISEVKLKWETAYGADFSIEVSNDAAAWTDVATAINNHDLTNDFSVAGTGRYVRMAGTRRGTQWGYSLWEFEVYGTATPPPPTGDLALNKPVVSSSDFSSDYAARFAVDGNGGTRWSSQFSDPQWIYVDLGQRYDLTRVKLTWETAYAAAYQIQVSNDAKNWVPLAETNNNTSLVNDLGVNGTGRYVRVYGTRRATQWGYSLFSFEVYGAPTTDTGVDLALHRDVVASSEFSADYHAGNVTDGNPSTRWSSEFSDPQWIYIDLGQVDLVKRVRLTWETAYGADYKIQMSYDKTSWWDAGIVTDGTGGVDDLIVGGTTRYVRMMGTRRGTEWGYSLWSFEVFGRVGP